MANCGQETQRINPKLHLIVKGLLWNLTAPEVINYIYLLISTPTNAHT